MIPRALQQTLLSQLDEVPAVVLIGSRQAGKTTLALSVKQTRDAVYLDMESPGDLAKLTEPERYLAANQSRLIIVDEVQRRSDLFPVLRGLIDRGRRDGRRSGLFLLLGSASVELLRQSGETLAGRASYLELTPFTLEELGGLHRDQLWMRGGYPESYLADNDAAASRWRQDYVLTYLERDLPGFGARLPAETIRRLWTMLAHNHGGLLNSAALSRSLGIDVRTINTYIDLMVDLFLVRRLQPWHANVGKRLVKSPRVYIRDSGILHTLLGIPDRDSLAGHPIVGASWEGFVVEQILNVLPADVATGFYRTTVGAEVDLVIDFPEGERWAIEVKLSETPRPSKGFRIACDDIHAHRRYVVYPGGERFSVASDVEALPLDEIIDILRDSKD